jgi:hypothetical protein
VRIERPAIQRADRELDPRQQARGPDVAGEVALEEVGGRVVVEAERHRHAEDGAPHAVVFERPDGEIDRDPVDLHDPPLDAVDA